MRLNEAGLLTNEIDAGRTKSTSLTRSSGSLVLQLIILSGDIALDPGPYRHPCGACSKPLNLWHNLY